LIQKIINLVLPYLSFLWDFWNLFICKANFGLYNLCNKWETQHTFVKQTTTKIYLWKKSNFHSSIMLCTYPNLIYMALFGVCMTHHNLESHSLDMRVSQSYTYLQKTIQIFTEKVKNRCVLVEFIYTFYWNG